MSISNYIKEDKKKRRVYVRWITAAILCVLAAAVLIAGRTSKDFADFYCLNIYPKITLPLSWLCGLLPFSVGEILLVIFILGVIAGLVITVVRIIKSRGKRLRVLSSAGSWYFCGAGVIFLLLTLNCLICYNRQPFSSYSGLTLRAYSKQELLEATNEVIGELNILAAEIPLDDDGICAGEPDIGKTAEKAMEKLGEKYPELKVYYPVPKPVILSEAMSYCDLAGIYFPFTVEANYNNNMPESSKGFTVCHELSHLSGFLREDEANFIAFLACCESDSAYMRYCGYLGVLVYLLNACHPVCSSDEYYMLYDSICPQVKAEIANRSKYWDKYKETVTAKAASSINDAYLKSNNQTDGAKSYGRVVDLLIADYLERNRI